MIMYVCMYIYICMYVCVCEAANMMCTITNKYQRYDVRVYPKNGFGRSFVLAFIAGQTHLQVSSDRHLSKCPWASVSAAA